MNTSNDLNYPVLISHRDPVVRFGLAVTLENSRYTGPVFSCGPQDKALPNLLAKSRIVVTDYEHGVDLCTKLQLDQPALHRNQVRVMVVSGRDREQEIRAAIDAGVKGYLMSGCELEEFIEGVHVLRDGGRYFCGAAANKMVDSMSREALTAREMQVLRCLVDGYVNKRISEELNIALGTVKAHVKAIFSKFGVVTRTQAVCVATERGVISASNLTQVSFQAGIGTRGPTPRVVKSREESVTV